MFRLHAENLPGRPADMFFLVTALNAQRKSFTFPTTLAVFRLQRIDRREKNPQGPSNGRGQENLYDAGVFWGPQKSHWIEGLGFLGDILQTMSGVGS